MFKLRPYQEEAKNKIVWSMDKKLNGNDLVVVATGGGKSIIIASLAHELKDPVLILQPSKEILEQNYEKLSEYVDPSQIGIYSASMGRKDVNFFTFATIQSIYNSPEYFKNFKLVIIDEAHLVNSKDMGSMFMNFLKQIGSPKVIGFTATPFRNERSWLDWGQENARQVMTVKLINRLKGFFWNRILFNISIGELIEMGYLCPLDYVDHSLIEHKDVPMNKSQSDFDVDKFSKELMAHRRKDVMKSIEYAEGVGKSVLVFCSSVADAGELSGLVPGSAHVNGKTNKKERERVINGFKDGTIKTVFNVGVLTTGFDHPALDCIVLLRPTRSIILYMQMVGRGVRIAEGKTSCKVVDLTGTVKSLGRVETIRTEKVDGKWDIVSETGRWHYRELYDFKKDDKKEDSLHNCGVNTSLFNK